MTTQAAVGDDVRERAIPVFGETQARVEWITAEQSLLERYVDEYEMCCDDGYYSPTERERELIRDALQGFVIEHDDLLAEHLARANGAIASVPPLVVDDAARRVIEAAQLFVKEGTRVTQRDGDFLTQVIEKKDRSDPHYKLCVALEEFAALHPNQPGDPT
jgi:hypothetical protein